MAYQKQTWRDFDDTKTDLQNINNGAVVTTERLNHIENGIANSADKAQVIAQLQQMAVSVTDFGAKGDGITDDRQAIQDTIDFVDKKGGGTVLFPPGTYRVASLYTEESDPTYYYRRAHDGVRLKGNITYKGEQATLVADTDCGFIFAQLLKPPGLPYDPVEHFVKNIVIDGLTFKKQVSVLQPFFHSIQIENCEGLIIRNCHFKGWGGDAICLGTLWTQNGEPEEHGYDDWARTIIKNVRIENCEFDGIYKNNRQAISVVAGEDIRISGCDFKNTTAPVMPGAIDIEPDRPYHIVSDIHVHDCSFDNIGGPRTVGAVVFALLFETTHKKSNFSVTNCRFNNCSRAYFAHGLRADTETPSHRDTSDFLFSGNTITNGGAWFAIGNLTNVTIQNETVRKLTGISYINSHDFGLYNNMENLNIIGNTVTDMQVKTDGDSPHVSAPFIVDNRLLNSLILNNTFIDVVRTDITNNNATWLRIMTLIKSNHYTLIVKDNTLVNTGKYALVTQLTSFIDIIEPVPDDNSIIVDNNSFINITLSYLSPLYAKTRVKGLDGQRSNGALFNERSSYNGSTPPSGIPVGVTLSAQGDFMFVTYKLSSDPSFSHMTVQYRYSSTDPTTFYTRLGQLNNTWSAWRYINAA